MYGENRYHQRFFFLYVRKIKKKKKTKIIVLNIVLYTHTRIDYENLREKYKRLF